MAGRLAESAAMIDKLSRQGMHMANEAQALAGEPQEAGDGVYEALLGVLASCGPGRAFLAEHARRSRQVDTETLLKALARIEALLAEQRAQAPEPPSASPQSSPAVAPAATALAAVAAQAMAAAEGEMPEVKVIKAGSMPPAARFAGEDFGTAGNAAETVTEPTSQDVPRPLVEAADAVDFATASNAIADTVPVEHAAPPGTPVADALAALLALSDDERLALFS
jgi:hypothetical protein